MGCNQSSQPSPASAQPSAALQSNTGSPRTGSRSPINVTPILDSSAPHSHHPPLGGPLAQHSSSSATNDAAPSANANATNSIKGSERSDGVRFANSLTVDTTTTFQGMGGSVASDSAAGGGVHASAVQRTASGSPASSALKPSSYTSSPSSSSLSSSSSAAADRRSSPVTVTVVQQQNSSSGGEDKQGTTRSPRGSGQDKQGASRSPRGTNKRGSLTNHYEEAKAEILGGKSGTPTLLDVGPAAPAAANPHSPKPAPATGVISPKSPSANFLSRTFSTKATNAIPSSQIDASIESASKPPSDTSEPNSSGRPGPKSKAASHRGFFSAAAAAESTGADGDRKGVLGKLFSTSTGKITGASFRGMGLGNGAMSFRSPKIPSNKLADADAVKDVNAAKEIGGESSSEGAEMVRTPLTRTKHNAVLHANFEAIQDVDEDMFDYDLSTTISLRAPCLHGGQGGELDDLTSPEAGGDGSQPLHHSDGTPSGRDAVAGGKKRRVSAHDTKTMFKKAYEKLCRENKNASSSVGGKISLEKNALRLLFHNLDDQSFEDVYTLFDWDNDGTVDLKEFIYTMSLILTKPPDDDEELVSSNVTDGKSPVAPTSSVDLLFNIFDLDSSGTMDSQEFSRMMRTILRCRLTKVDFVLKSDTRRGVFRTMLQKEYAEESLDFWERVSQWRDSNHTIRGNGDTSVNRRASLGFAKGRLQAQNGGGHQGSLHGPPMQRKEVVACNVEAKAIFDLFVEQGSPKEVNIPGKMRRIVKDKINENAKEGGRGDGGLGVPPLLDPTLFDDSQSEIYHLMNRDTFSRFKENDDLSAKFLLLLFSEIDVAKKGSIGIQEYRAWSKLNPEIMQFWRDLHAQTTAGVVKAAATR